MLPALLALALVAAPAGLLPAAGGADECPGDALIIACPQGNCEKPCCYVVYVLGLPTLTYCAV